MRLNMNARKLVLLREPGLPGLCEGRRLSVNRDRRLKASERIAGNQDGLESLSGNNGLGTSRNSVAEFGNGRTVGVLVPSPPILGRTDVANRRTPKASLLAMGRGPEGALRFGALGHPSEICFQHHSLVLTL